MGGEDNLLTPNNDSVDLESVPGFLRLGLVLQRLDLIRRMRAGRAGRNRRR